MHEFRNTALYFKVCSLSSTAISKKRPGLPLPLPWPQASLQQSHMPMAYLPWLHQIPGCHKILKIKSSKLSFICQPNNKYIYTYTPIHTHSYTYILFSPLKMIVGNKAMIRDLLSFILQITVPESTIPITLNFFNLPPFNPISVSKLQDPISSCPDYC